MTQYWNDPEYVYRMFESWPWTVLMLVIIIVSFWFQSIWADKDT